MTETPSIRSSQLYQILNGKANKREKYRLFDWEPLLDALLAFYDVCCTHEAQKRDKHVSNFARKYKSAIEEIRHLRVTTGDFDIVKTIGRGHFGEVHVVKEKGSGDIYAMKILKKSSTLSQDNMAFFEEERDIMAFADSPWVTGLQYAFQDAENLYLVMEFHPGGDLLTLLQSYEDGIMEEDSVRFYLGEIILAVHAVHVIGYVHRDVKPENILLDMTGHIKLADFGSSARLSNGKSVVCKMPVGTPEYIAPEVLMSMNSGGGVYGSECDWWSVGVVAYEMMCGCLPFEADGVLKLYSQIMDFKNSLCFPDDIKISDNATNLITGLLEDQKTRLNYTQLATHDFFKSLDWTTLKSVTPPYIPELKDSCDTSHFSDFKTTKTSLKDSEYTLGNTLPFLGFNFTRYIYQSRISDSKSHKLPNSYSISSTGEDGYDKSSSDVLKEFTKLQQSHDLLNSSIEALKRTCTENDKKIKKLETENTTLAEEAKLKTSSLSETNQVLNVYQSENENLKKQLEHFISSNESLPNLQSTLESVEYELQTTKRTITELQNDKRLFESRIKSLECELEISAKKCNDSEIYWKEFEKIQLKTQTENKIAIKELQALLDKTSQDYQEKLKSSLDECAKYRCNVESLECKLVLLQKEIQAKEAILSSVAINNNLEDIDSISSNLKSLNEENVNLKLELGKYEEMKKRLANLEDELKLKQSEFDSKEITILKLNQTIRSHENQLDQLTRKSKEEERLFESINEKLSTVMDINQEQSAENSKLKITIDEKDKSIRETKELYSKLKNSNEIALKKSEEKIELLQQELTTSTSLLKETETELVRLKSQLLDIQTLFNEDKAEKDRLNGEIEKLTSLVSTQKVSNFSLSQQLEELIIQNRNLLNENEEINSRIDRTNSATKEQIIKLETTIAQQNKLINFLHEDKTKKTKGGKTDMERKGTPPPNTNSANLSRKGRDLEHQLELERMESLRLNNEVIHLRQELSQYRNNELGRVSHLPLSTSEDISSIKSLSHQDSIDSKRIAKDVVSTPESSLAGKEIHVGLPQTVQSIHLFQNEICTLPITCPVCWIPIPMLKPLSRCSKCKIFCHSSCENDLPKFNCSPCPKRSYIIDMANPLQLNSIFNGFDGDKMCLPTSGCLSIPHKIAHNKYDWQKKWFCLSENELIISNKINSELEEIGTVKFHAMKSSCSLHPAVHTSDIVFATTITSFPLIFGLEIPAKESQHTSLETLQLIQPNDKENQNIIIYMMVGTLSEKRLWIRAFENVLSKYLSREKNSIKPMQILDSQKLNCVRSITYISEETMLIASIEGVYLSGINDKNIYPCFASSVSCYDLIFCNEFLFALIGEKRSLSRLLYDKGKKVSKMTSKNCQLTFLNIFDMNECFNIHSIEASTDACTLIVIRIGEILIIKSALDTFHSKLQRISIDSIPSSIIKIDNTLFLCQDKFYTIDITSLKKTELLDPKDHSLAFMIYGSSGNYNFPMNIFLMNRNSLPEFLICCSEFGVVVDIKGRRTLNRDLRWDQIPASFHFYNNKLYICYSDMIEIRQFWNDIDNDIHTSSASAFKYILGPKIIGPSFTSDSVILCNLNTTDFSISLYKCGHDLQLKPESTTRTSKVDIYAPKDQTDTKHSPTRVTRFFSRKKKN